MKGHVSKLRISLSLGRATGGGTEAHANWLCGALQEAGIQTELYPLFPDHKDSSLWEECVEALTYKSAFSRFVRHTKAQCPSHIICFGRVANCLGYRLKKEFPGIRLIATCRTSRRLPKAYQRTLAVADLILVNSSWAAERVRRLPGICGTTINVIPNALLRPELLVLERSESAKKQARHALGLNTGGPVLCMMANFVSGKNQECLVRLLAAEKLPPGTCLLLVGDGPRRRHCERLARKLGLSDTIQFMGRLDSIDTVLLATDLMVTTSLRDSLPNTLIEAQAAGLPVVAYDIAGVGEAIQHRKTGLLVKSGDELAFAGAVCRIIVDKEERDLYSKAAREKVQLRFDPEEILSKYLECLHLSDAK